MSSRAYRRLLKAREKEAEPRIESHTDEVVTSEEESSTSNPFAALQDQNAFSAPDQDEPEITQDTIQIPEPVVQTRKKPQKESKKTSKVAKPTFKTPEQPFSTHSFETKLLNHYNELEHLFGKNIVKRPTKRLVFCDLKPTWNFPARNFMQMTCTDNHFCFQHPTSYRTIQERFFELVEFADPQLLGEFLKVNPFHIDTLLVLAELCKTSREHASARDLIERALFAMEKAFHPLFVAQALAKNAQLPYAEYENRAFHLVLYKHIQFVMRKGAWESAFEMAQFLLYLDFDTDPMGMLYLLDFLALRCNRHQFIINFYNNNCTTKALATFPSWNYSLSLAYLHSNQIEESQIQLSSCIIKFPTLLARLVSKCGWKMQLPQIQDATETFFDIHSEFWNESERILDNMEKLYSERTFLCWKQDTVQQWVEGVLVGIQTDSKPWIDSMQDRKAFYSEPCLNFFRHLVASDVEDSRFYLPQQIVAKSTRVYDLLPPERAPPSYADRHLIEMSHEAQSHGSFAINSLLTSLLNMGRARTSNDDVIREADN